MLGVTLTFVPSDFENDRLADELPPFRGAVEVDETYIGGESKNMPKAQREARIKSGGPVVEGWPRVP